MECAEGGKAKGVLRSEVGVKGEKETEPLYSLCWGCGSNWSGTVVAVRSGDCGA